MPQWLVFLYYILKKVKTTYENVWNVTKFMVECNDVMEKIDDRVKALKFSTIDQSKSDSDSDSSEDSEYNEVIVYNHNIKRSFCNLKTFTKKLIFLIMIILN